MSENVPPGWTKIEPQLFPQPWQPPDYTEIYIRQGYQDLLCGRCGAVVTDQIMHNRHHRGIDQVKDGLVALTAILVPGLPPATLLSAIGTAIDVGSMIQAVSRHDSGSYAKGGEGGSSSGGQGGTGAVGVSGRITPGRGGGGNNPMIPECPGCGAYGGGGHGGGCRNSDLPVSEWS